MLCCHITNLNGSRDVITGLFVFPRITAWLRYLDQSVSQDKPCVALFFEKKCPFGEDTVAPVIEGERFMLMVRGVFLKNQSLRLSLIISHFVVTAGTNLMFTTCVCVVYYWDNISHVFIVHEGDLIDESDETRWVGR